MTKAYWYRGRSNFGDALTELLLTNLGVTPHWCEPAEAELVIVGSILLHLPDGWAGTVCGVGLMYGDSRIDLSNADVLALRGTLTAARVTCSPGRRPIVIGDPGLLVSRFVTQPTAKYDFGIIPHWSDTRLRERYPHGQLIDVNQPPAQVVSEIASCQHVISSSLHGIVVADAFGVPRQAELFPQACIDGGDFKFRDYASALDETPRFGEMWRAPSEKVERIQDGLWEALAVAVDQPQLSARSPRRALQPELAPEFTAGPTP